MVIGDQTPVGICGSGILAVLKELIREQDLSEKIGAFVKKENIRRRQITVIR